MTAPVFAPTPRFIRFKRAGSTGIFSSIAINPAFVVLVRDSNSSVIIGTINGNLSVEGTFDEVLGMLAGQDAAA